MAGSNEEDDEPSPKWMMYDSPERVCVCVRLFLEWGVNFRVAWSDPLTLPNTVWKMVELYWIIIVRRNWISEVFPVHFWLFEPPVLFALSAGQGETCVCLCGCGNLSDFGLKCMLIRICRYSVQSCNFTTHSQKKKIHPVATVLYRSLSTLSWKLRAERNAHRTAHTTTYKPWSREAFCCGRDRAEAQSQRAPKSFGPRTLRQFVLRQQPVYRQQARAVRITPRLFDAQHRTTTKIAWLFLFVCAREDSQQKERPYSTTNEVTRNPCVGIAGAGILQRES